jgi:uncharacterized RDD family membrane protein YckC
LRASNAGFWPRLRAGTLDWLVCGSLVFVLALAVGVVSSDGGDSTIGVVVLAVLASAPIVTYFAYFWARGGATPGMRVVGLRVMGEDGGMVGVPRALLRAVVALADAAAVLAILVTGFSDRPEGGYSDGAVVVLVLALAFAAVSLLGHLWLLVGRRQTWHDRLFGLLVVPAEATATEPAVSATPPPPD